MFSNLNIYFLISKVVVKGLFWLAEREENPMTKGVASFMDKALDAAKPDQSAKLEKIEKILSE